jgi:hypothetical protein
VSKFTQGKWQIIPEFGKQKVYAGEKGSHCNVFDIANATEEGIAEKEANARLIAEAPEMFRQIIALTEYLEEEKMTDCDAYREAMYLIYRVNNRQWKEESNDS